MKLKEIQAIIMKFRVWFAFLIVSFACMSCEKEEIQDVSNPNILRSAFVDDSGLHLAFPTIAGNADRSKIIILYREGSGHLSFDGKLIQLESSDKGKTWKNRKVIYTPASGQDARDPQLLVLPDNQIVCRFFERGSDSKCCVKSISSDNFGKSYENLVDFPFPGQETSAAARGNMILVDDVIYTVCYNKWAVTWLVKSVDYGKSWQIVSWLDERLWTGKLEQGPINESSLGYCDGKMYIVGRQQSKTGDKRLEVGVSEDMGKTWTWDFLPVEGQAPSLTPYKDAFILTYRNVQNSESGKYSFDTALLKNGKLASKPVSLFISQNFDIGYGDVLTLANSFLVCCYQPGKIRTYEIKYDVFN